MEEGVLLRYLGRECQIQNPTAEKKKKKSGLSKLYLEDIINTKKLKQALLAHVL